MPCTASGVVGGGGVISLEFEPSICDKELTSASDSFLRAGFLVRKAQKNLFLLQSGSLQCSVAVSFGEVAGVSNL